MNDRNWNECLESLGFKQRKNNQFGGMIIYDDREVPMWAYETKEEKEKLYLFFKGAVYWKIHMMLQ